MNDHVIQRLILATLLIVFCHPLTGSEPEPASKLFDGTPKVFVVHGYSTSRDWPRFLQQKLDRYFDGKRIIEVQSAIRGGTPIAKWIDVESGERQPAWNKVLKPKLQRNDDRPTIVLAQQSLQWVYGERTEGIRNADDEERIRLGADVLQRYGEALLKDGAGQVFIAMHIYKRPMEPEIGHERLALAALVKRDVANIYPGPDVWQPTRKHYPQAFARDGVHPNEIGARIMAQQWFETLLRHDDLQVPEWSRKDMLEAIRPDRKKEGQQSPGSK